MGLGSTPATDRQHLGMLGMHGTYEITWLCTTQNLVLCVGARFDDRVNQQQHQQILPGRENRSSTSIRPPSRKPFPWMLLSLAQWIPYWMKCSEMIAEIGDKPDQQALDPVFSDRRVVRVTACVMKTCDDVSVKPQEAIEGLYEATKGDAFITSDGSAPNVCCPVQV